MKRTHKSYIYAQLGLINARKMILKVCVYLFGYFIDAAKIPVMEHATAYVLDYLPCEPATKQ